MNNFIFIARDVFSKFKRKDRVGTYISTTVQAQKNKNKQ